MHLSFCDDGVVYPHMHKPLLFLKVSLVPPRNTLFLPLISSILYVVVPHEIKTTEDMKKG